MASISHCPADTQHRVRIDVKNLFWKLPYSLRRKAFLLLRPGLASYYDKLLHESDGEYSIRPMLAQKCLFIHIPKCAGIAVSKALFNSRAGGHLPLAHYQLIITPQQYKHLFKFTVVRNPYARLLSAYRFLASGGLNARDAAWAQSFAKAVNDPHAYRAMALATREEFDARLNWRAFGARLRGVIESVSATP